MDRSIRAFTATDEEYRALAALQALVYPEYPFSPTEIRHEDDTWDHAKFFLRRWLVFANGEPLGWAQLNHSRGSFVPTTYWLDVGVVPAARRHGHGAALYEEALKVLAERGATRIRSGTKESMSHGISFLEHRGFTEAKRDWESRLFLGAFDFSRFAGARERVEEQGHRLSTIKDELARDPESLRKAFECFDEVHNDVPTMDSPTPLDFNTWQQRELHGPSAMLDAYFVAIDPSGRHVGLSALQRSAGDPTFFWQGLTGVRRDSRGRGIALALKLETIRFARDAGVEHIKTWNDQRNRPMLAINEALGFVKQPAWIQFQKDL